MPHPVPVGPSALGAGPRRQWPTSPFDRWETFPWGALRGGAGWRPKARTLSYAPSQAPVAKDSPNPKGRDGMGSKFPVELRVGSDHTQPLPSFTLHCAPATMTFLQFSAKLIPASGPLHLFPLPARFFQGSFPLSCRPHMSPQTTSKMTLLMSQPLCFAVLFFT